MTIDKFRMTKDKRDRSAYKALIFFLRKRTNFGFVSKLSPSAILLMDEFAPSTRSHEQNLSSLLGMARRAYFR